MLRRIWAVMQKEFVQIFRDRRTLAISISLPMIQLFILGYAIRMNVDHIPTVVFDQSNDTASHAYVSAMVASGSFDVIDYLPNQSDVIQAMDEGRAYVGIVIPSGFASEVTRGRAQVLLLVDGSDFFTSLSAYSAASIIAQEHATEVMMTKVKRAGLASMRQSLLPLDTRIRVLYNPNLEDLWFLIPGMLAMLLQVQTIALTATSVVRERERGNIEQILVTPIRSAELMLGKLVPTATIAFANLLTILGVSVYWFGVPFQGDLWLFLGLALLYVLSGLGLGLLASTVSQNQKQAHQVIGVLTLIAVMLGGFMFPRYNMPRLIRFAGGLFPLTYFVPIAQGIITKGVGIAFLREHVAALLLYIVVIIALAVRAFRPHLD